MIQTIAGGNSLLGGTEHIQRLAQFAKKSCQSPTAMQVVNYISVHIYLKISIDIFQVSVTIPKMPSFVGGGKDICSTFFLENKKLINPSSCFFYLLSSFQSNSSVQFFSVCFLDKRIYPRAATMWQSWDSSAQFSILLRTFLIPGWYVQISFILSDTLFSW